MWLRIRRGICLFLISSIYTLISGLSLITQAYAASSADLNHDGSVGIADLSILLADWGGTTADLNGDGSVGLLDFSIMLKQWQQSQPQTPTPSTPVPSPSIQPSVELSKSERDELMRWGAATYNSMVAMTDPNTGLVADNIGANLSSTTRSRNTSPTNIGMEMISTLVAGRLGLISPADTTARIRKTLGSLSRLERHASSGLFYNWYDITTLQVLQKWPGSNATVYPFVSSVDNAWLAAGLKSVAAAEPSLSAQALNIYDSMDFTAVYNAERFNGSRPGLFRGGFWTVEPKGQASQKSQVGGQALWYTVNDYDLVNTETRIISYVAIAKGIVPPKQYFSLKRTFSPGKGYAWTEQMPTGINRLYEGISVYEGTYNYRGQKLLPSWGGSMFEELMPDLVVPEADWGALSWRLNHRAMVNAQIAHGLDEAGYGYWGFSPSSNPFGGYKEYGVDELGISPDGYPSDREATNVDKGYGSFRPGSQTQPQFGDGIITPHASFLALPYAPQAAIQNLKRIETQLKAYGPGGFYDAVATKSKTKAATHLSLDQGMIMAALGNALNDGVVQKLFSAGEAESRLRPVLQIEQFGTTP